jgi:GTP-binding protein
MRNQAPATQFIGSFPGDLPQLGLPEVAFAGRSNVGKSSALNTLLGSKKAARVSSRPGRTQTINLFQLGNALCFADLPGYGYARVPEAVMEKWKPMVERYLGERDVLRLVVLLIDGRHEAQEMDLDLYEGLRHFELPVLVVATKVDKLPKHARKPQLNLLREAFSLPEGQPVPFSSLSGEGVSLVWDAIEAACRRKR